MRNFTNTPPRKFHPVENLPKSIVAHTLEKNKLDRSKADTFFNKTPLNNFFTRVLLPYKKIKQLLNTKIPISAQMKCSLSEDELSLLSTPEGFVVTKVQTFEKKDSLKIKNNKKSKKKTFAGPIQNYIRVSYRDPNSNYRQVERKFEGEELDILPSAQIIISEIPTTGENITNKHYSACEEAVICWRALQMQRQDHTSGSVVDEELMLVG